MSLTTMTNNRFTVHFCDGETDDVTLPYGSSRSDAVEEVSKYRPRNEIRKVELKSGELPKIVDRITG